MGFVFLKLMSNISHERLEQDYEFTPIGYSNKRENFNGDHSNIEKDVNMIESKKRNISTAEELISTRKRSKKIDDTIHSRLFNDDTSFEDTIPEQSQLPTIKKELVNDLLNTDLRSKTETISNPLKEQQDALFKLNMDNYNLRLKCNSLLKFLNSVTDEGELKKNLEILDDLQDWKSKYQVLNKNYTDLQVKFDELENKESNKSNIFIESNHSDCEKVRKKLQSELEALNHESANLKNCINKLRETSNNEKSDFKGKEEQYHTRVELLESEIHDLKLDINVKDSELQKFQEEVRKLSTQLQEFNHQSGTLLETKKQLDLNNQTIKNLEIQLERNNREKTSLEHQLLNTSNELDNFKKNHLKYQENSKKQMDDIINDVSVADNLLKQKIESLIKEKTEIYQEKQKILKENEILLKDLKKSDGKLNSLKNELEDLKISTQDDLQRETDKLKYEHEQVIISLENRLKKSINEVDNLSKENTLLKKHLDEYIEKCSHKEFTTDEFNKRGTELTVLRSKISQLQDELDNSCKEAEESKKKSSKELILLKDQIDILKRKPMLEIRQLEREISTLKFEAESLKESKEREVSLWETKYLNLKRSNEGLLKDDTSHSQSLNKLLEERLDEIRMLGTRCSELATEKLELNKEISNYKNNNENCKKELKKTQDKLEFITKEFVKIKESQKPHNFINNELNSKWNGKYQRMKDRFLEELKSLQRENLELEKNLLEIKNKPSTTSSLYSPTNSTTIQDQTDYYRLKYHTEVRKNNDLRVMNEYLNRVMKASAQHVRLDILKLGHEIPSNTHSTLDGYRMYKTRHSNYRLISFKSIALAILACVRMKHVAIKRRWDMQRLGFLQKKIALGQEHITW